jgi:5'(3')-deoxyribonucleotidase
MRIGIDFDGTFADVVTAKIAFARELFGIELPPDRTWPRDAVPLIGEERYRRLEGELYSTGRTLDIPPIEGAIEVAQRLAESHELFVLTARTDAERGPAEAWVRQHELPISRFVHTNRGPKPPVCLELQIDVLLDDWEHSFVDMRAETRAVLLDQPHNRHVDEPHITRVESWHAFEGLIAALDRGGDATRVEEP